MQFSTPAVLHVNAATNNLWRIIPPCIYFELSQSKFTRKSQMTQARLKLDSPQSKLLGHIELVWIVGTRS